MERLDKILANARLGSRKEVTQFIKAGRIKVGDQVIKDPSQKFIYDEDRFYLDDEPLDTRRFIYLIMNKPEGYLSATEDNYDPVVIDLLEQRHQAFSPFTVGRLDKDTRGLLLLTNDGDLNHKLISPRWHVDKVYIAKLRDPAGDKYENRFLKGVVLDDGYRCLPAEFKILSEDRKTIQLTIQEGKFHQVKRMFETLENKVVDLQRIRFRPIDLPPELKLGEYCEITATELLALFSVTQTKPKDQPAAQAEDETAEEKV